MKCMETSKENLYNERVKLGWVICSWQPGHLNGKMGKSGSKIKLCVSEIMGDRRFLHYLLCSVDVLGTVRTLTFHLPWAHEFTSFFVKDGFTSSSSLKPPPQRCVQLMNVKHYYFLSFSFKLNIFRSHPISQQFNTWRLCAIVTQLFWGSLASWRSFLSSSLVQGVRFTSGWPKLHHCKRHCHSERFGTCDKKFVWNLSKIFFSFS